MLPRSLLWRGVSQPKHFYLAAWHSTASQVIYVGIIDATQKTIRTSCPVVTHMSKLYLHHAANRGASKFSADPWLVTFAMTIVVFGATLALLLLY